MSDLISRQAAIDAIMGKTNDSIVEAQAIDILCDLPSAQQWISTEERHPKDGDSVLVTVEGWDKGELFERDVDYAVYVGNGGYMGGFDTLNDWIEYGEWKVTAWMPCPKPWKGGEDADG